MTKPVIYNVVANNEILFSGSRIDCENFIAAYKLRVILVREEIRTIIVSR